MTKILVAGIGGVGGYFGGLLAKAFDNSEHVDISFLARGKNLEAIKANGLTIIKGGEEWIVRPKSVTDHPADLGKMDLILLCIKSYDLEATMLQLRECIADDTIILPLLNGVDSKDQIQQYYPGNIIAEGCVYIISRLTEPGKVENTGTEETLFFGMEGMAKERFFALELLFREAGIQATYPVNIATVIWEKFIFIASIATATSFYDHTIGEILADDEKQHKLSQLVGEAVQVAKAKQIILPPDIKELTLNKLRSLPDSATSSMHTDFKNKRPKTELQSLTGYVVAESNRYNIQAPVFEQMYRGLNGKNGY